MLLTALSLLFFATKMHAQNAGANNTSTMLESLRKQYDLPALAVVVTKDGRICERAAVGVRKVGDPALVTTNDVFHIGSCTKSMTATVTAILIEQGRLRWDTTIAEVFPELKGKLDGYAMRVPTPDVSVVDLVVVLKKNATAEEVNEALKAASEGELKGILGYTTDPVVSTDMLHNPNSSIVDADLTKVIGGNLAKVVAWYDNEWGYSSRVVDLIDFMGKQGL